MTYTRNYTANTVITKDNADIYVDLPKGKNPSKIQIQQALKDQAAEYMVNLLKNSDGIITTNVNKFYITMMIGNASCLVFMVPDEYVGDERYELFGSPHIYRTVKHRNTTFSIREDYIVHKYGLTFCLFGQRNPGMNNCIMKKVRCESALPLSESYKRFLKTPLTERAGIACECKSILKKNL